MNNQSTISERSEAVDISAIDIDFDEFFPKDEDEETKSLQSTQSLETTKLFEKDLEKKAKEQTRLKNTILKGLEKPNFELVE